jgi:hypothetical protein
MYVDFLSDALRVWDRDLATDALVDHVVDSRARLLSAQLGRGQSAYELLAAEIAYDRALIRLCNEVGIATSATSFAVPMTERRRIERALVERYGLDLHTLSRARRVT